MILQGKAFRFVADCIDRLSDQRLKDAWGAARSGESLSPTQLEIALHAIDREMTRLKAEIEKRSDDLDYTAPLRDDLMILTGVDRRLRSPATVPAH